MQKDSFTETYDFLVSIIGHAPIGIISINMGGMVTMCNSLALSHLHITGNIKALLEKPLVNYIDHIPELSEELSTCVKIGRKSFNYSELSIAEKILSLKGRKIINGMVITTNDLTKIKNIDRDILKATITGQDDERIRIAKDIHDGIGPIMSTIKLSIDSIQADINPASSPKINKKLALIRDLVTDVSTDIRSISHDLMPSALKDFGVKPVIENFISKIKITDTFDINFFFSGQNVRLDEQIELALYRIAQELVNNAIKYSKAKNITVQLFIKSDQVFLTVEDNGVGISSDKIEDIEKSGIGFYNVYARTRALNGYFNIDSKKGQGTTCSISFTL